MSEVTFLRAWDEAEGARRAGELFRSTFGGEVDGVWSAPGRVNLIGEHTDYNGGLCLPIALPHRTYVAVRRRPDRRVRLVSAQEPEVREVDLDAVGPAGSARAVEGWPAYAVGVAWALERDGLAAQGVPGFDIAVDSCVPYGAGLSSSAALECAVAVALDDLASLGLADDEGRAHLAAVCVRAENEIAGAPTGGMDQAASLRSRAGHALLLDCRDGSVAHVPFDLAAAGLALLVIDTRAEHRLVDGQYAERRRACERAAATLGVRSLREVADASSVSTASAGGVSGQWASGRGPSEREPSETPRRGPDTLAAALERLPDGEQRRRVRHVVTEIWRVRSLARLISGAQGASLAGAALADVAANLDASHESLRLDYEVSSPELDLAVVAAREAGAHGARMTGGGFGGSAIALVHDDAAGPTASAVTAAFVRHGFGEPGFLLATAGGPAGRVAW